MKKVFLTLYWIVALLLVASILASLGYKFSEALFIGTAFLPCALAIRYFFPKTEGKDKSGTIKNRIFLVSGIIVAEIFILLLAHLFLSVVRDNLQFPYVLSKEFPEVLTNPIFIIIIIAVLTAGRHFTGIWLNRKYPANTGKITFLSDRKSVSMDIEEILYVESNDSVTIIVATDGRHYRNKTPISQWEAILDTQFIRIHRSFLVNKSAIDRFDADVIYIGETELPVSRKYKNLVRNFEKMRLR